MKKFLENKILHPFLITIFPALFLYTSNLGETKFRMAIASIMVILLISSLIVLIGGLISKNIIKSAILSSMLIFSFLSYQHFNPIFNLIGLPDSVQILYTPISLIIWLILLLIFIYLVQKAKNLSSWNYFLNIIALILMANIAVTLISFILTRDSSDPEKISDSYQSQVNVQKTTTDKMPDIYYIILDGYGRADILNSKLHFDNSPFINFLKNKKFFVADSSSSNYSQTAFSLSSSLNINYLTTVQGKKTDDRSLVGQLIADNTVVAKLNDLGYNTIGFSANYEFAKVNNVKQNKTPAYWSEFNQVLLENSFLSDVPYIKHHLEILSLQVTSSFNNTNYIFEHIDDEALTNTPKFTFAHILAPHPPFILDKNGIRSDLDLSKITVSDGDGFFSQTHLSQKDYIDGYTRQLEYINKKAQEVIENIISKTKRPVVIVVQGDHGSGSGTDFQNIQKTDLPERMSILNAYYFSDQKYDKLYPEITPVNTFRVIFDQYFGADLPLLEDKNYFSLWNTPYEFIEVTDKVNKK